MPAHLRTRLPAYAASLLVLAVSGCDAETRPPDVAAAPSPSAAEEWGCVPGEVEGFATDPVVRPPGVSLGEAAPPAIGSGSRSVAITDDGTIGTVTYRSARGRIVMEYEYSRGQDTGWQLERGRSCFSWERAGR